MSTNLRCSKFEEMLDSVVHSLSFQVYISVRFLRVSAQILVVHNILLPCPIDPGRWFNGGIICA